MTKIFGTMFLIINNYYVLSTRRTAGGTYSIFKKIYFTSITNYICVVNDKTILKVIQAKWMQTTSRVVTYSLL